MSRVFLIVLGIFLGCLPAAAQLPSNATLNGTYFFRYLGVIGSPCDCPISFIGTVVFDGRGGFQVNGQGSYNNGADRSISGSSSGQYQVLSSGMLSIANPFAPSGTRLFGGIGRGVLVASSTDSGYLDLLVAIPASSGQSNAVLTGDYRLASFEFAGGSVQATRNAFFAAGANGAGGFAPIDLRGTSQSLQNVPVQQTITGAAYNVTGNGTGTLNLPAPAGVPAASQLLSGNKTLYVASGGNFFLAGSPTGYDLILGIKAGGGPLQGLYFTASLQNQADGTAASGIFSSQGSVNELGNPAGDELVHQRVNADGYASFDQTFRDNFVPGAGGLAAYSQTQYAVAAGGEIVIAGGNAANYQISINVKVPSLSGSGVFLNPNGVVNAATNAPFTAQVSPGEVISLYGEGLSSSTAVAASLPFPTTLGGAQVTINGTAAPVYYASSSLLSVVVPYSVPTDGSLLTIQVNRGGTLSNSVQVYSGATSPGVFTVPAGGLGNGAIRHNDFSVVTPANPARPGEVVQIYVTGLGAVQPAVAAGASAPSNPLSVVVNPVAVYIDGRPARITYQGLAPTLAGLYQLNVEIPAGAPTGSLEVEIATVDADTLQATVPVAR